MVSFGLESASPLSLEYCGSMDRNVHLYLGKSRPVLERVVGTNQRREQVFWRSIVGASVFRGVLGDHQVADTLIVNYDGNEHSSASSRLSDFWTPKDGFIACVFPTAPFPAPSAAEMATLSLADRLAPFRRRTKQITD